MGVNSLNHQGTKTQETKKQRPQAAVRRNDGTIEVQFD